MMSSYDVGYGKPPEKSGFKPGVSGNPKGRPKRAPSPLAEIVQTALEAPMNYRDKDITKVVTRHEVVLKLLVERAVMGDVAAAELVLKVRAHAQRYGETGIDRLLISDWLPDYPGQTAAQKMKDFARGADAEPVEWWQTSARDRSADSKPE
jgi:Family of unknown function (DUF5681)